MAMIKHRHSVYALGAALALLATTAGIAVTRVDPPVFDEPPWPLRALNPVAIAGGSVDFLGLVDVADRFRCLGRDCVRVSVTTTLVGGAKAGESIVAAVEDRSMLDQLSIGTRDVVVSLCQRPSQGYPVVGTCQVLGGSELVEWLDLYRVAITASRMPPLSPEQTRAFKDLAMRGAGSRNPTVARTFVGWWAYGRGPYPVRRMIPLLTSDEAASLVGLSKELNPVDEMRLLLHLARYEKADVTSRLVSWAKIADGVLPVPSFTGTPVGGSASREVRDTQVRAALRGVAVLCRYVPKRPKTLDLCEYVKEAPSKHLTGLAMLVSLRESRGVEMCLDVLESCPKRGGDVAMVLENCQTGEDARALFQALTKPRKRELDPQRRLILLEALGQIDLPVAREYLGRVKALERAGPRQELGPAGKE